MERTSQIVKEYDYAPNKWQVVMLFVLALSGTGMLAGFAVFLDRPINARGVQLTQLQARVLFGAFAAFSLIGLYYLGALAYVAFIHKLRVAITNSHLIVPRSNNLGITRDETQIPLNAIESLSVGKFIGATQQLRVDYVGGNTSVFSNMFRGRAEFDDLCQTLDDAIRNTSKVGLA